MNECPFIPIPPLDVIDPVVVLEASVSSNAIIIPLDIMPPSQAMDFATPKPPLRTTDPTRAFPLVKAPMDVIVSVLSVNRAMPPTCKAFSIPAPPLAISDPVEVEVASVWSTQ
jgi:hypothetical protein